MTFASLALAATLALTPSQAEEREEISFEEFMAAATADMDFQTGSVELDSGEVTFDLPEGWAFLQTADARTVVEDIWGNPDSPEVVGFIDPPSPMGRLMSDYGIVVTLNMDGYISDDDAHDIDFDEMNEAERAAEEEANEELRAAGFSGMFDTRWAERPHYDAVAKKIYFARSFRVDGNEDRVLNYDVHVLGRRGSVKLSAVSAASEFDQVQEGMKTALRATSFNDGHRYEDFDSSIDRVAAYGIGGLVAGKVAAKAGLFAVLAKFGKFIILGIFGAFVAMKRFVFGSDKNVYASEEGELAESDPA